MRDQRRAKSVALVAVTVVAALLVALGLALSTDDAPPAPNPQAAAPQIDRFPVPANVASTAQPGTRYDGGPEEGSRDIVAQAPSARYDGGPEEGTALSGSRP